MRLVFAVAAALACAFSFAGTASAQTTYPLNCRAGGNMTVNVLGGAAAGTTEIVISYDRATVTTGLPAGSCSWVDRTLNSREPRAMRIVVRARMSIDLRPRPGDHAGDRGDLFVYPGSGPDVATATSIINTLKAGGSFQVTAYNPGRGVMIATNFVAR
ncbi:hypothetical protein [Terricaulis sp.]|uniref:hypothetical protein n=1 Tax=Terricaulis sp. TaxID=2768686 RepID=UPI003784B883